MPCRDQCRALIHAAIAALTTCLAPSVPDGFGAEIVATAEVIGKTPDSVGYNCGHFLPDSNTASWWRYSGVNAARIWAPPSIVEGKDDNDVWGDGVASLADFQRRRRELREKPLDPEFINWDHFRQRYAQQRAVGNVMLLDPVLKFFVAHDIKPLVVIHRPEEQYRWAAADTERGWADRWEHWQHFYAQAFYLASKYGVERFQMYNEPDLPRLTIPQDHYLERLQFASDAVQAAVSDVNRRERKSLVAQMQAPVTSGGSVDFHATPGKDPRDDERGWGEMLVQNRHRTYAGRVDPKFTLFQTYAYQQYNLKAADFGREIAKLRELFNKESGGEPIRFALTEFNPHTASLWETSPNNLDTPSKLARFGALLASLANNQPNELYIFKFSQTGWTRPGIENAVKKNGCHYVDNGAEPFNIGDSTKGGEVVRLFAKGFAGGRELLAVNCERKDLYASASRDEAGRYSLLVANESSREAPLRIDVSAWKLADDSLLEIEQVSADRHGEVVQVAPVGSGVLEFNQPGHSVILVSVSRRPAASMHTLPAVDDAMVKAGANAGENYGNSKSLLAKCDAEQASARNVSFIKFDLGESKPEQIDRAVLRVWGKNEGSAKTATAQVYGLLNDKWREGDVTWRNAPNLADSAGKIDDISQNFIEGVGESAEIVGHLTGRKQSRPEPLMLDVTRWVQAHSDQQLTFAIARQVRFDGESVSDAAEALKLASKEAGEDFAPTLTIELRPGN